MESWARSTELLVNHDWSRAMEVTGVLECEMCGSWVNRNSTQRMRDAFEQSVTVKRRRNAVATSNMKIVWQCPASLGVRLVETRKSQVSLVGSVRVSGTW